MKKLVILLLFIQSMYAFSQVGIGKVDPEFILDINSEDLNLNGINLDHTNFSTQFLAENSTRTLVFNNTIVTGFYNYRFAGTTRFIMDNASLRPAVNSNNNVVAGGLDIGRFDSHFRRVYTQGIHTNDNGVNGGLRINIGAGGGTNSDFIFSDFAYYPTVSQAKDLGRNGNFWNNFYFVNAFTPSDRRLKENIKTNSLGLETINTIKTYEYNYISDKAKKRHFGVMAQELQKIIPELIDNTNPETGMLAVNYTEVIPVLIKAIQEQTQTINNQASKIEKLEADMKLIKEKLGM